MKTFREFISEGSINPIFVGDKDIEALDNWISNPSKFKKDQYQIIDKLEKVHSKYEDILKKVKLKFESIIKKESRKYNKVDFKSNSKGMESIIDKALTRKKGYSTLNDLVRGALLFQTKEEADKFLKDFVRKNKSIVIEVEEKKRGQGNVYGYYGAHHLGLNIDGVVVELQLMTKKLWSKKTAAHDIYVKNRSSGKEPDNFDRYTSKKIFSMGNRPGYVRESEDDFAEFTYEELHEMQFDNWEDVAMDS